MSEALVGLASSWNVLRMAKGGVEIELSRLSVIPREVARKLEMLADSNPEAKRHDILRLLGPKTVSCGVLGWFEL